LRGSFTQRGEAGKNSLTFNGKIGGHKLTPGSYRLIATPTSNGVAGSPQSITFQIVR
jgi:hypothetical protein